MPQVRRWYIGLCRGRVRCNYHWDAINNQSVVLISASEGDTAIGDISSSAVPDRFVGNANFTVRNIAPYGTNRDGDERPGGVRFVIDVGWDERLPTWADIVLLDEVPQGFSVSDS